MLRTGLHLDLVDFSPESLRDADLVVLLVDHPEFDADEICRHAEVVFDAKGVLRGRSFDGETL